MDTSRWTRVKAAGEGEEAEVRFPPGSGTADRLDGHSAGIDPAT
jgi:hypothetical protein